MFSQTIYKSHENWGETVYANLEGMEETIASLHDLGDEWAQCSIEDCDELEFVSQVGKYGIYSESWSSSGPFVALAHYDGSENYYTDTDSRGVVMFYGNDLSELVAEINESIERSKAAAVLGSRGGTARTDAKANAARINGKRGGRPRKS